MQSIKSVLAVGCQTSNMWREIDPVRIPELSRSRLFLICLICQIRGPAADELTKSLLTNSAILLPNADSFFSLKLSRQYSTLIGEKNAMLPNKKT